MTYTATLTEIKNLFQPTIINSCTNSSISIIEKDKAASLKLVTIASVGASAFSIKLDECGFPGLKIFQAHPSLHRACDSIAFCEVDGEPYILCCELKSSQPNRKDVAEQFRSAQCFLEYINVLLNYYCKGRSIADWPRRYYVFHSGQSTPLAKSPSRDVSDNLTPETAQFIPVQSGHTTYLRKLLKVTRT